MDAFLRVWEEFVNIVTIGNDFDRVVLSKVRPYYRNGKFFVVVKDEFTKAWIEKSYLDRIVSMFRYYDVEVEVVIESGKLDNEGNGSGKGGLDPIKERDMAKSEVCKVSKEKEHEGSGSIAVVAREGENEKGGLCSGESSINPKYTFENFVVGPSNDLAYHSALSVSRYPGRSYNPLFIYGGVGLGKTHLLHAIANEIYRGRRFKKVLYVTSEQFTNEFFKALSSKTLHSFRLKYREVDVLLIDDVQFFRSSMKQAIEELFHTFNKLAHDKKQMVFTSDRSPRELEEIGDRMISRFEGGLVVEIRKPEFETRLKILDAKFRAEGIAIDDEFKSFIANSIVSSVRSLESAVNRVSAFISFRKGELTLSILKSLLRDLIEVDDNGGEVIEVVYTPEEIIKAVAEYYNTTPESIVGCGRREDLIMARQFAMYLMKRLTKLTFSQIGERFGKVHSTAVRAYERVDSLVKRDVAVKEQIKGIIGILKGMKGEIS